MNLNKNLIIFSENYPYNSGEQYLINDLYHISKYFNNVLVFPHTSCTKNDLIYKIPDNLSIEKLNYSKHSKFNLLLNFKLLLNLFYHEIILSPNRISFIKELRKNLSLFSECLEIERELNQIILKKNLTKDYFHSLWMNKYALVLSIAKYKKHINKFTFRVHGYDIFVERHSKKYIPFEKFNYAHTNKVILNSLYAYRYKLEQTIYKTKLDFNYFSIEKTKQNPFDNSIFHIVSCSNLIPLKRVHLIFNALKQIKSHIKWTHIGDGHERKKFNFNDFPKNIEVNFMGQVNNNKIHEFYSKHPINLFVHVSETEGLGYAIFEALSYGIPCLVCNSGGTIDLVNDKNGKLLPNKITHNQLAKEIETFKNSTKNSLEFRKNIITNFNKKYQTEQIIKKLLDLIKS